MTEKRTFSRGISSGMGPSFCVTDKMCALWHRFCAAISLATWRAVAERTDSDEAKKCMGGMGGARGVLWTVGKVGEGHPIEETWGGVPSNVDREGEVLDRGDYGCSENPGRGKESEEGD